MDGIIQFSKSYKKVRRASINIRERRGTSANAEGENQFWLCTKILDVISKPYLHFRRTFHESLRYSNVSRK